MNRRLILIVTLVLILAAAATIFLYFWNNKSTNPDVNPPLSNNLLPSGLPGPSGFGGSTSIIGGASTTPGSNIVVLPRLRHLTLTPTSGSILIARQVDVIENRIRITKDMDYVRYVDRATGHIYELNLEEAEALKITNTTIPRVYEALFLPQGNTLIARLLAEDNEQILTYSIALRDKPVATSTSSRATVGTERALNEQALKDVTGTYLPSGIREIAISPSGARILSLTRVENSGVFTLSNASGGGASNILTHPIYEWLVSLPNESTAVVATKPSGIVNGYAYTLNLSNGSMRKIVGGIAGLTVLPNANLTRYLGGATPSGTLKLFTVTDSDPEPKILPLETLPEKCVWARTEVNVAYCAVPVSVITATYPDDWYRGTISFIDQIWKINTETEETTLISDLSEESGQAIDATYLSLAADDGYLTFINKIDLTLWGLDLTK